VSTQIAGKGLGTRVRITSTDAPIREYLAQVEADTFGRDCERQGEGNTWWAALAIADRVEQMLDTEGHAAVKRANRLAAWKAEDARLLA
jgi:hypothetical protein